MKSVNPFVSNAPFLYPLKTSENRKDQLKKHVNQACMKQKCPIY